MKIFSKAIIGLFLSVQVFSAPLEVRQGTGTFTTAEAAVNRLLSRILTEIYSLNAALSGMGTLNLPGMLTAVQNDITSLTSAIGSVSSIVSGATGTVSCTAATSGDITMLLTNLGMAQTLVSSLSTTLTTAASSLNAGDISSLGSSISNLENAVNGFNVDLQAYAQSLLPCVSTVSPTLVQPVQSALANLGNIVQNLLDQLGVGGVLNGLITALIP